MRLRARAIRLFVGPQQSVVRLTRLPHSPTIPPNPPERSPPLKITAVKVRLFEYPMPRPFHPTWQPVPTTAARIHVVEVHTDEGIVGIGSGGVPVRWEVAGLFLMGQDPFAMEQHVANLRSMAFFVGRPWPVEIALWDIGLRPAEGVCLDGRAAASGGARRVGSADRWRRVQSAQTALPQRGLARRREDSGFGAQGGG